MTRSRPEGVLQRERLFCAEYLKHFNRSKAYRDAGFVAKNSNVANASAAKLLERPTVQEFLAEQVGKRFDRLGVDVDRLVSEYTALALADVRDIVEVHKSACRYCYGIGHRYQETPSEEHERRKAHDSALRQWLARAKSGVPPPGTLAEFDALGGIGYDPRKEPAEDCPECFGEGKERIVVHDTRNLPPEAAKLYAGVKVTDAGMQVLTHDKSDALKHLGMHLGMFVKKMELSGPGGGPIPLANLTDMLATLSPDERAALRPILTKLAAIQKAPTK